MAEAVGARDVIVPVAPGITAAVGLLKTDLQYEHTKAGILILDTATDADLARINLGKSWTTCLCSSVITGPSCRRSA